MSHRLLTPGTDDLTILTATKWMIMMSSVSAKITDWQHCLQKNEFCCLTIKTNNHEQISYYVLTQLGTFKNMIKKNDICSR